MNPTRSVRVQVKGRTVQNATIDVWPLAELSNSCGWPASFGGETHLDDNIAVTLSLELQRAAALHRTFEAPVRDER